MPSCCTKMNEVHKGLVVFQDKKIRRIWLSNQWYFSVIDIVYTLTESVDAKDYWYRLKQREVESSGIELSTFCRQLKLPAEDNKLRLTDCANTESIFRLIQSIPSKKAEPFKLWLAKVGYERIQEIENPELAQERMKQIYEQKGYSKEWINQRLKTIEIRKELTDEWNKTGLDKESDFAYRCAVQADRRIEGRFLYIVLPLLLFWQSVPAKQTA